MKLRLIARSGNNIGTGHWKRGIYLLHEALGRRWKCRLDSISSTEKVLPTEHAYDVTVIDDPVDAAAIAGKIREKDAKALIVALDFYGDTRGIFDGIINVIERTPEEILNHDEAVRYSGLKFMMLDYRASNVRRGTEKKTIAQSNVFVAMGGTDPKHSTLAAMKALISSSELQCKKLTVLLRSNHSDYEQCKKLAQKANFSVEILDFQESLVPFLENNDLVICNGGGNAALSVLMRVPAVFCPQTKQEEEFVGKLGARVEQTSNLSELHAADTQSLVSKVILQSSNAFIPQSALDNHGAKRILDALIEMNEMKSRNPIS